MKTRYPFLIVAAFGAATALHGALAELNVAEGTIETPDGAFISRDIGSNKAYNSPSQYQ